MPQHSSFSEHRQSKAYPTGKVALFAVAHLPVLCHPRKNILHIELHTTLPAECKKEEADFSASSRKSLDL
jgi:hypothetical protein